MRHCSKGHEVFAPGNLLLQSYIDSQCAVCSGKRRWDIHRDGQWWNAPDEQMFWAYYQTLRVHYGMYAWEALATARKNREALWIGHSGPIELIRSRLS